MVEKRGKTRKEVDIGRPLILAIAIIFNDSPE